MKIANGLAHVRVTLHQKHPGNVDAIFAMQKIMIKMPLYEIMIESAIVKLSARIRVTRSEHTTLEPFRIKRLVHLQSLIATEHLAGPVPIGHENHLGSVPFVKP